MDTRAEYAIFPRCFLVSEHVLVQRNTINSAIIVDELDVTNYSLLYINVSYIAI